MSQSTRILVTGAHGSLATLITDHFRTAHELMLFSRSPGDGFHPHTDLFDAGRIAGTGVLLHLAWSTLPATSELGRGGEGQADLAYLARLLASLGSLPDGRRPHLVFFSSGGTVYGNAPGRPSVESDPCQPIGSYGRAKLAAEALIEAQAARLGLACTTLRISNPYGYPVPPNRVQGLIPHALRCAVTSQPLTLWGDGTAQKDFLHYTDFLSALDLVVARPLAGTFNLAAGESHTVREVLTLVEKTTGRPVARKYQPGPSWDVHDSRLDNHRFVAATGWRPQVTLDEGIRRAAARHTAC